MDNLKNKHLNVSVSKDLRDAFKKQSIRANKSVSQMIREFMEASIDGRLSIKKAYTEYERELYNIL